MEGSSLKDSPRRHEGHEGHEEKAKEKTRVVVDSMPLRVLRVLRAFVVNL
jgi:Ni,Fe-hydrogenase I large subunit